MAPSSTVEFLIFLLLAASAIAVVARRLRAPYTVALVVGGLLLGSVRLPLLPSPFAHTPDWLTPEVSLIIFLPALLFEGSLRIPIRHLRENLTVILLLATAGVLAAALICGFMVHWVLGIPLLAALVFGAIVAATDPVSVLSVFKDVAVDKRLSVIVEGESLFNDGTAVVMYGIFLSAVASSHFGIQAGVRDFFVKVLGGVAIGLGLGYVFSKLTQRIDDPQIEITLTTILAYGSYLLAQSLHLSGVIATVSAGLIIGNYGIPTGMSSRTRIALWSFWEYASFLINSILFLLIGLQVKVKDLAGIWPAALATIAAVVAARMLAVYGLVPISNLWSAKIPLGWRHILVWGGMRGALSLALALSLSSAFPHHSEILTLTFTVVAFTIVAQGVTIKPLIRMLKLGRIEEDEYSRARVRQIAVGSAISELDDMFSKNLMSDLVYQRLRRELGARLDEAKAAVEAVYAGDREHVFGEVENAKHRLMAAEKSSIEQAFHQGLISSTTAAAMVEKADALYREFRSHTASPTGAKES